MLSTCDTANIKVDESKPDMELIVDVMKGKPPGSTFDTRNSSCWDQFKKIMVIADKYDCHLVRERSEKWLVSRCLRGRVRCDDFKFQDVAMGLEWLLLCQKYGLRDLGWYVSYDLGSQLADGAWPHAVTEFLKDMSDPEFLKVMLEAVSDSVQSAAQTAEGSLPLTAPE
eukprot:CAMPEP_0202900814 /NCGR_PEP_ID=MMETSP1392-20130828/12047_1 /ASSEMBLY_ACC=CAM_ASM_000868 /TAXON_ID=225041 /ORGANISM="Chlamydomonas chlamydogama, Strain SAG 11-48b" /LENGTH=168 /DNA_ID=CAMNT_0049587259 /DNA_START=238 /DNA_END=744 /DNA_ORIENTATION=-